MSGRITEDGEYHKGEINQDGEYPLDDADLLYVRRLEAERDDLKAERDELAKQVEKLTALLDAVEGDAELLLMAVNARDPTPELRLRVNDILKLAAAKEDKP